LRARMNCCEFREKYSDYADGVLTSGEASDARRHLAGCPPCRRFDAAFRAGVGALRGLPRVDMSRGFGPRLRARLSREFTVRLPVVAHWSGAMGTLLLVATVGVVGLDLLSSRTPRHDTFPVGLAAPASADVPLAVTAPVPVPLAPSFDATTQADAFHPLESVLVEPAMTAPVAVTATAGAQARYDFSVAWGGQ
jgi:anti-sigma factor RsiW